MIALLAALVPVFAMIAMGHLMRRYGPYGDGFWLPAERLNYFVLFPALLVASLARAEIADIELWPMAAAMAFGVLAVAGGLYALRARLGVDGPGFTALFQGAIRPNSYVALAGAAAMYDDPGLTLAAVAIAVVIPLVNVLSVAVLSAHGADRRWRDGSAQLLRNPIILACVLGIALNLSGLRLPAVGEEFLRLLGRAALPLGLLCVGASLDLAAARSAGRAMAASAALKLLAAPGITALLCLALGVQGATADVAVLFNGCPASAASYILTRQLGGDHRLMAGIITVQTVAAMLTLPLLMLLPY
ncbi:MAG: AEC family transporter [Rhodospirillales bacterium]